MTVLCYRNRQRQRGVRDIVFQHFFEYYLTTYDEPTISILRINYVRNIHFMYQK